MSQFFAMIRYEAPRVQFDSARWSRIGMQRSRSIRAIPW